MSRTFTIVPRALLATTSALLSRVARDPAVRVEVEGDTRLFFGGAEAVLQLALDGNGLACLRILGSGVLHVDPAGYAASVEHLAAYLRWLLGSHACKVFDDESGRDLSGVPVEELLEVRPPPPR